MQDDQNTKAKNTITIDGKELSVEEFMHLKKLSGGNISRYLKRQVVLEDRLQAKKKKNRAKNKVAKATRKNQRKK